MKKIAVIISLLIIPGMLFAAISRTEAEAIALKDSGAIRAEYVRTERGREHGRMIFEVEFYADGIEYDYEIDAETGEILSKDYDIERFGFESTGEHIDEIMAEEIALRDAGITAEAIVYMRSSMDREHGRTVYEIRFSDGRYRYEYGITADGGRIIEYSRELLPPDAGSVISIEEATRIALSRVPGATEKDIRIRAERDDGRRIYEGSIWYGRMEYEFGIDAATGRIIEWDRERR